MFAINLFKLCLLVNLALLDRSRQINAAATLSTLRVIRSFAQSVVLQCPTSYYNEHVDLTRVRWLNEKDEYTKPDQSVAITPGNLLLSSQLSLPLSSHYEYISCGYVTNNYQYVRLGFWKLQFIDNPSIDIKVKDNPPLSQYTSLNQTFGQLSVSGSITNWTTNYDLLRFKCVNNFDYPINTKYVWMYLYNPVTCLTETWYRYDIDEQISTYDNIYQVFYNSNKNIKLELSQFLKYLFTEKMYIIKFQCASYCDSKSTNSYLFASSYNLTIIGCPIKPTPRPQPHHHHNTAALVGGILGGLLGLVLLLGLLILLLCCCCKRHRAPLAGPSATIENTHVAAKSSTLIYPVPFHSVSAVHMDRAGHPCDVPTLNLATDRCYYDPTINVNTVRSVVSARSRPEHYLNILTIHRDVNDCDDVSLKSEHQHCYNSLPCEIPIINQTADNCSRRYIVNDDCHQQQHHQVMHSSHSHHRNNEDLYAHNYQQQQEYNHPRYI